MKRALRHLVIAVALLLSQQAAQLHVLSHLGRDMARMECGGKCIPPASHPAEQCIAYHAVDSALPNCAVAIEPTRIPLPAVALFDHSLPFPPRIEFDSRAPPALS